MQDDVHFSKLNSRMSFTDYFVHAAIFLIIALFVAWLFKPAPWERNPVQYRVICQRERGTMQVEMYQLDQYIETYEVTEEWLYTMFLNEERCN